MANLQEKDKSQLEYDELHWKVQQLELTVADLRRPLYKKISFWTNFITLLLAVAGITGQYYVSSYKNAKAELETAKVIAARDSAQHKKDSIDRKFKMIKDSIKSQKVTLISLRSSVDTLLKTTEVYTVNLAYAKRTSGTDAEFKNSKDAVTKASNSISNILLKHASSTLLKNSRVTVYYMPDVKQEAKRIDSLLKSAGASSKYIDHEYSIGNINQIVYYNGAQLNYGRAVQALLKNAGLGNFPVRPSSGKDTTIGHFKIYVVK